MIKDESNADMFNVGRSASMWTCQKENKYIKLIMFTWTCIKLVKGWPFLKWLNGRRRKQNRPKHCSPVPDTRYPVSIFNFRWLDAVRSTLLSSQLVTSQRRCIYISLFMCVLYLCIQVKTKHVNKADTAEVGLTMRDRKSKIRQVCFVNSV